MLLYSKNGVIYMSENNQLSEVQGEIAMEIMHVYRKLIQYSAQRMGSMGISVGQAPILRLLKENGTMSQRQIAEETRVTPATICGTLKRMEKAGMILRTQDETDGRVICVSLTAEGDACCNRAWGEIQTAHGEMMKNFTAEECGQMRDFIRRMEENLIRGMEKEETNENR